MAADQKSPREYIVLKASERSGKGYFLSIRNTQENVAVFDFELGVYVGSDTFRIASTVAPLETSTWVHLVATYNGTYLAIYKDGSLLAEESFSGEPEFQRPNHQPLHVGQNFEGYIDEVKLFEGIRTPEDYLGNDAFCPQAVPELPATWQPDLIAHFAFNEGEGYSTQDLGPNAATGYLGLICDTAGEEAAVRLECPPGYTISEILYANYGVNDGECGAYEVGECAAKGVAEAVEIECLGKEECMVRASGEEFGDPCVGTPKTLAVSAICTGMDPRLSPWSAALPPTWYGTVETGVVPVNFSMDTRDRMPPAWWAMLESQAETLKYYGGWDFGVVRAGERAFFPVFTVDRCGLRRFPATPDMWALNITSAACLEDTASASRMDCAFPIELLEMETMYPTCYPRAVASLGRDPEFVAVWGGEPEWSTCDVYRDVYAYSFVAPKTGVHTFEVSYMGETIYNETVNVPSGPLANASFADVITAAEASVPVLFFVAAADSYNNPLTWDDGWAANVSLSSSKQALVAPAEMGPRTGFYKFEVTFLQAAAHHTLTLFLNGEPVDQVSVWVDGTAPRSAALVAPAQVEPSPRFEHAAAVFNSTIVAFGGAATDKTYLSETWVYDTGVGGPGGLWQYRLLINMTGEEFSEPYNVEVLLDTAAMYTMGRIKCDCSDFRFVGWEGDVLRHWVDPYPGCQAKETRFWVRVPCSGPFYVYYGNSRAEGVETSDIFEAFEDFEFEGPVVEQEDGRWQFEESACTDAGNAGDPLSFNTTDAVSLTGSRALKVDTESHSGGTIFLELPAELPSFVLKGYFFDAGCAEGGHWMSPDFEGCTVLPDGKTLLPHNGNGAGLWTCSAERWYSTMYPWTNSRVKRVANEWHAFAVYGFGGGAAVMVDDIPVKASDIGTTMKKISLHGGLNKEGVRVEGIGYWDTLFATAFRPNVTVELNAQEERVLWSPEPGKWSQRFPAHRPPARQAHSASAFNDSLVIFGGERSAYEYSDLWSYDPVANDWSFIQPSSPVPPPRHDHAAAVWESCLIIHGGRSPGALSDLWSFDFNNKTWMELDASDGPGPLFGHSAVTIGDEIYFFGGYSPAAGRPTNAVWRLSGFGSGEGLRWVKVGPRFDLYVEAQVRTGLKPAIDDAILFPSLVPEGRFAHQAWALGGSMYIAGGLGGPRARAELADVWRFDTVGKVWAKVSEHSYKSDEPDTWLVPRYDAAPVVLPLSQEGAPAVAVYLTTFGGHRSGAFLKDVEYAFAYEWVGGDLSEVDPVVIVDSPFLDRRGDGLMPGLEPLLGAPPEPRLGAPPDGEPRLGAPPDGDPILGAPPEGGMGGDPFPGSIGAMR